MRFPDMLRFRIASLFKRSEIDIEMDDELRSHIEHRADDLERSGLSHAEAQRRARIEFGGYQKFKEECRETVGFYFLETLLQDLRLAFHRLGKSPGFTAVAVGTLALAIGANAVVFGVMDALVLRPLNVPQAGSLYVIGRAGEEYTYESYPNYIDLRDRTRSFDGLAADNPAQAGLDTGGGPTLAWGFEASGNYFDVLGVQPYLGRFFHASDEHGPNSAPYLVLTYDYWHTHFHADSGVVGRTVRLNKYPFTIIGVAPPKFRGTFLPWSSDFFVPIVNQEQVDGASVLDARGNQWMYEMFGHLKPGLTPAQAIADLNSVGSYLKKTYPKDNDKMTYALTRPGIGDIIRPFVAGLMLLAGLILLAACANLGSLFAARAADRSREVALRLALGATRLRILRQLLTEAIVISLVGGAVGLWASVMLLVGLSTWQPFPEFPINVPVSPDASVYGTALLLALASGFLFGAIPVKQALRTDPYEAIKSGSAGPLGGSRRRRITAREVLLATQIAICALLVTSSLVAVRGLARSLHSNLGVEPQNAMLVDTDVSRAGYTGNRVSAMQRRMIDAVRSIAGVSSVGLVGQYPPLGLGWNVTNVFTDRTTDLRPSSSAAREAIVYSISPEYFQAARTTLLTGRTVTWHDDKNSPRVAVINQEFARRIFGSVPNAVGAYFQRQDGTRIQVVGVVEDGKYTANIAETPQLAMFLPLLQSPSNETFLVVRSDRDPQQLATAIRATLRNLDAGLTSFIQTWNADMNGALFAPRMAAMSLGVLGVMGALLSIIGIFGMAAYSVSKRKKELGIRIALGAQRKEILRAALERPLRLLAFGSVVGLLLGIAASRVLASIVYEATSRDPLVLTGAVLAMMLLGLLATWVPARRALSIEPSILMREE